MKAIHRDDPITALVLLDGIQEASSPRTIESLAETYLLLQEKLSGSDPASAMRCLEAALRWRRKPSQAWENSNEHSELHLSSILRKIGALHERSGRSREALACYESAIASPDPMAWHCFHSLGNLQMKMKDYARAASSFESLLKRGPVPHGYLKLGDARLLLGEREKARAAYSEFVRRCGNAFDRAHLAYAHYKLAALCACDGRFEDALEHLRRMVEREKDIEDDGFAAIVRRLQQGPTLSGPLPLELDPLFFFAQGVFVEKATFY